MRTKIVWVDDAQQHAAVALLAVQRTPAIRCRTMFSTCNVASPRRGKDFKRKVRHVNFLAGTGKQPTLKCSGNPVVGSEGYPKVAIAAPLR